MRAEDGVKRVPVPDGVRDRAQRSFAGSHDGGAALEKDSMLDDVHDLSIGTPAPNVACFFYLERSGAVGTLCGSP